MDYGVPPGNGAGGCFTPRGACRGGRPRPPLGGGLGKRRLTPVSYPAAVSRRPGEREGEDTLPYNGAPTSFSLHRAKSLRNFVTFAHAHRRFQRVFNWPNLCNVYKSTSFPQNKTAAGPVIGQIRGGGGCYISLRWHYPNQVNGSRPAPPLSLAAPLLASLIIRPPALFCNR